MPGELHAKSRKDAMVKLLFLTNSFSTSCANSWVGKEQSVAFRLKLAQAPTAAALRVRVAMQSPRPIKHTQTSKAAHLDYVACRVLVDMVSRGHLPTCISLLGATVPHT